MKKYIIITITVIICLIIGIIILKTNYIDKKNRKKNDWKVEITDIVSKEKVGSASDDEAPTHTATSATFQTTLVSPGDSMTYDVTVTNSGKTDAKVANITLTDAKNPAIIFKTSGINKGDIIKASKAKVFSVKVAFKSDVTKQPEELTSSLTVKLDYVEKP